jgi:uncharacterized membrane protein (UPF0127 family)
MSHRAGELVLRREDDERVLCERCVLADTLWRRMRGLLGRAELEPGEGIVLRPAWSIHTFFMRFPIDVVFVDADQVVLKVVGTLRPWRAATCRGARDVIELRAGECMRLGLQAGDRLTWAARPGPPPEASGFSVNGSQPLRAAPGDQTRVLLGTSDDRFLRLARFLLTRNNFKVESTKRVSKTVDLVDRHGADIVVIDATDSLGDAARAVAAMEALHPHVGVIVVCDGEPPRWTTGLRVTEKWTALESLSDDIRHLSQDAREWN